MKQINLRLSVEIIQRLKELARKESVKQNKDISYLEMIKIIIIKYLNEVDNE